MSKNPSLYIEHILDSIQYIEQFTAGVSKEEFLKERMRYDATLRNLQTLSESTQKLPQALKDKYKNIPWKDIAGFRNILVHDYLEGLDVDIVWHIVKNELPVMKTGILEIKKFL